MFAQSLHTAKGRSPVSFLFPTIFILITIVSFLPSMMPFLQFGRISLSVLEPQVLRVPTSFRATQSANVAQQRRKKVHTMTMTIGNAEPRKRTVVWFRNDLRVDDNLSLVHATEPSKNIDELLPIYCFDPRQFSSTDFGTKKTGALRARFLIEAVSDLRQSLQDSGSGLYVAIGNPEEVLPRLIKKGLLPGSSVEVVLQEEVTTEEMNVDQGLEFFVKDIKDIDSSVTRVWGPTLYHPRDLPMTITQISKSFTPWRKKVEDSNTKIRKAFPAQAIKDRLGQTILPVLEEPDIDQQEVESKAGFDFMPSLEDLGFPKEDQPDPDQRAVMTFTGGETAGLKRVKEYLWETDNVATYFETRNGMLGKDYSTKFSPWLALGCISPRRIFSELQKYENQRVKNKSTYWVVFELIWRDYFRFNFLKHGPEMFYRYGLQGSKNRNPGDEWKQNEELFQRWVEGKTGWPLVDANMRELAATGWMSNRGRQNVGSFLCLDLQLDWRKGAYYFEEQLLDYDVCSNWGNWHAIAGLSGGRINRFNIVKQSKDYDPEGDYLRCWLPELASVPAPHIHEPWKMNKSEQQRYHVMIGEDYPRPVKIKTFQRQGQQKTIKNRKVKK